LLKLLYLADLAYAQAHAGETYTGIEWEFHNFGPWSKSAWERAVVVLDAPAIECRTQIRGAFERTTFRFMDKDDADGIFLQLDHLLPPVIVREVGTAVHEFGSDTKRLLHHVYKTAPMRTALPGDRIDFTGVPNPSASVSFQKPEIQQLSNTQQKKVDAAQARLRASIKEKAEARKATRVVPWSVLSAKEMAALEEITRILSEDEDQAPTDLHGEMVFTPEFWRSDFRREHGLS